MTSNLLDRLHMARVSEPAKPVRRKNTGKARGNTVSRRGADGRYLPASKNTASKNTGSRAKARKAQPTKGAQAYRAGLTRKAWNDTFSAKIRLAGSNPDGVSYYTLAVQDPAAWAEVRQMRVDGLTPNEAVARVLALA